MFGLLSLTREGYLSWGCRHQCRLQYAHISDSGIEYRYRKQTMIIDVDPQNIPLQPGAIISLPPCPGCGDITELKADYTLEELCNVNSFNHYFDAAGNYCMSALKHGHVRNLVLHHMLYEAGKSPCHPELPLAPSEVLDEPLHAGMDMGVLYSMWWSHYLIAGNTDVESFVQYAISLMSASKRVDLDYTQQKQIGTNHDTHNQ